MPGVCSSQAQTVSLVHRYKGADYLLNLIDTPGAPQGCLAAESPLY